MNVYVDDKEGFFAELSFFKSILPHVFKTVRNVLLHFNWEVQRHFIQTSRGYESISKVAKSTGIVFAFHLLRIYLFGEK